MVKSFQFSRLPLIIFGNGKVSALPGLIGKYGTSVILVTGSKSFSGSEQAGELFEAFSKQNILFHHIIIGGEPSPSMIDKAVAECGAEKFDAVVGIGGGSVLDAAKAISAMIYRSESVRSYLEGVGDSEHPGTKIPFIAVPTTSGTGSEATKNAVISQTGAGGFKRSLRHDNFVPDIALVDPLLTVSCPPAITSSSGMDTFTQLTEAFLSVKSNEYTEALSKEGLKAVKTSLAGCYRDGQNREYRAGMSFAALTSGICLANAGLGVVHGLAGSVGGIFDIPHGIVCGTLMAKANKVNVREMRKIDTRHPGLRKYAELGELFLDEKGKHPDYYIDGFIDYLQGLTDDLNIPGLGGYGMKKSDLEMICRQTDIKNNPVGLSEEDLLEIITERFI